MKNALAALAAVAALAQAATRVNLSGSLNLSGAGNSPKTILVSAAGITVKPDVNGNYVISGTTGDGIIASTRSYS